MLGSRATGKALGDNHVEQLAKHWATITKPCQKKGDVEKVNQKMNQLVSRGEGADNEEDVLLAAYQHIPDVEFRK